MVSKPIQLKGISYRGKGYEIRISGKGGKLEYFEKIQGPPTKAGQKDAITRRDYLIRRKDMGLSLREGDGRKETFAQVADRWFKSLQLDPDTEAGYWNTLALHWLPHYENLALDEITQADILERLAATGLAVKTQKNITGPLRAVLKHANTNPNPAVGINWPKRKGKKRKTQRYTPDERVRIVQRLSKMAIHSALLAEEKPSQKTRSSAHWADQAQVYFPLLFATGMRPGEVLGLLWRDYDGEYINVEKQYTRGRAKDSTKTGHDRSVYVPSWVRSILGGHSTRLAGGPIFTGYKGCALKDTKRLNPVWEIAHDKERIPCREPYVCRHTRASELLSQGVPAAEAADELGHSTQMFLEVYASFVEEFCGKRDMSKFESRTMVEFTKT
jgi:integrase